MLIAVLAFTSCEEDADSPVFVDTPVVEAYLSQGTHPEISISRLIAFSEDVQYEDISVEDLSLYLTVDSQLSLMEHLGDGVYTNEDIVIEENQNYDLEFLFGDLLITASAEIPSKPVGFEQSATSLLIEEFVFGGGLPEIPDPIELNWSNTDDCENIQKRTCSG